MIEPVLFFVALAFALAIWAMVAVSRRVENPSDRVAYYLLIWLVPYIGILVALLLTRTRDIPAQPAHRDASEKMFDEVVAAHRRKQCGHQQ
ncbi:MAG: hypothetical protein AAF351_04515 [Pseudomonadota bacterium]